MPADLSPRPDPARCPLCAGPNRCAMEVERASGEAQAACWCTRATFSPDLLAQVPATARGQACLCAACAGQPSPGIIMIRAFEPSEQGRASGLFGMGVVLAPALGPSIGGVLVDLFGWRSIFFMVVPFCFISIYLAYKFVPTSAPGGM